MFTINFITSKDYFYYSDFIRKRRSFLYNEEFIANITKDQLELCETERVYSINYNFMSHLVAAFLEIGHLIAGI